MASDIEVLLRRLRDVDRKFKQSCEQIVLLNSQMEDLQVRYDRATKLNRRSFRYTLRIRLSTLEGLRNAYYEYASKRANELEALHNDLLAAGFTEGTSDITDSDSDSSHSNQDLDVN